MSGPEQALKETIQWNYYREFGSQRFCARELEDGKVGYLEPGFLQCDLQRKIQEAATFFIVPDHYKCEHPRYHKNDGNEMISFPGGEPINTKLYELSKQVVLNMQDSNWCGYPEERCLNLDIDILSALEEGGAENTSTLSVVRCTNPSNAGLFDQRSTNILTLIYSPSYTHDASVQVISAGNPVKLNKNLIAVFSGAGLATLTMANHGGPCPHLVSMLPPVEPHAEAVYPIVPHSLRKGPHSSGYNDFVVFSVNVRQDYTLTSVYWENVLRGYGYSYHEGFRSTIVRGIRIDERLSPYVYKYLRKAKQAQHTAQLAQRAREMVQQVQQAREMEIAVMFAAEADAAAASAAAEASAASATVWEYWSKNKNIKGNMSEKEWAARLNAMFSDAAATGCAAAADSAATVLPGTRESAKK